MKVVKAYILFQLIVILQLLSGCTPAPSKGEVEELIVRHFEIKHYKVEELKIGAINPIPENKKQYMGTPGYIVDVTSLILEIPEDSGAPWNYKKGQKVSFNNSQITVRQGTGQDKKWIIAHISGVPVP